MRQRRTHYEVLGIERTATPEEIKRQYRKLVKRYHPDVAGGSDAAVAHAAFIRISEAYEVLSDPFKRSTYDHDLRLHEAQTIRTPQPPPPPRPNGAPGARASAGPTPRASAAGTRGSAGPAASGARAQTRASRAPRETAQLLFNAQMDYTRGRLQDALAACQEVLRRDRRCAGAYSLMGDIYRTRGRADDAIRMYTMAVQFNPTSKEDMAKLDRLARHNPLSAEGRRPSRPLWVRLTAAAGTLLVAALLVLPAVSPGDMLFSSFSMLDHWTENLLIGLVGASALLGFLGAITGTVGRLDDELVIGSVRTSGGRVPVGVLMLLISILFYPLALILYLVIAIMDEGASPNILYTLIMATLVVFLLGLAVPSATGQTLLFGGNLAFPCAVLGNLTGGFFRDPWS